LLLVVLSALVFFVNLGTTRLWDVDEAIFSQAAVEMYERGEYVVPYFNDQLLPDKPVLTYWMMISAYKVFGVNEFAARFWSAVFGLGSVLLTYQLGRRLFSPRIGFWAGLILATNLNFGIIARAATPDALLTFCTTLAVYTFVCGALRRAGSVAADDGNRIVELAQPGWGTYALTYAAMGAGVLVKGPVGVVLPTAILGLFQLCTRGPNALAGLPAEPPTSGRWGWLSRLLDGLVRTFAPGHFVRTIMGLRPITALAAVLLVAGPWYVWVGLRTDGAWLAQFFGVHNFGRFLSAMDNHRGPMVYYLIVIPLLFFPWSILLLASVRELATRAARSSASRPGAILVACWLAVYLGFFSLASTKLPNYIIPCYPALALMTALFVERWTCRPASLHRAWLWIAFAFWPWPAWACWRRRRSPRGCWPSRTGRWPGWHRAAGGAVAGMWLTWSGRLSGAATSLGFTAAALALWVSGVSVVQADRFQNTQSFVDTINQLSDGPAQVASFRYFRPSLVFYGTGRSTSCPKRSTRSNSSARIRRMRFSTQSTTSSANCQTCRRT